MTNDVIVQSVWNVESIRGKTLHTPTQRALNAAVSAKLEVQQYTKCSTPKTRRWLYVTLSESFL